MAQAAARKRASASPRNDEPEPLPASVNGGEPDHELTVEEWLDQNRHKCYLHAGGFVWIRIPDLADFLLDEALPEELERAAVRKLVKEFEELEDAEVAEAASVAEAAPDGQDGDAARARLAALMDGQAKATRGAAKLTNLLVLQMVESPKLSEAQLRGLPPQDRDMLANIAMRGYGTDARGNRIGEPVDARGTVMPVTDLAGLEPFRVEPDSTAGGKGRKVEKRTVPRSRKGKV